MKSRFNNFIRTNSWLKLASLILAIGLWFFVVSKGRSVIVLDVPLEFKNIPSNLEVVDKPETISLGIEGQKILLDTLKREDISVVIDLSDVKKGKTFLPVSMDNITVPKRLAVTEIIPQNVRLLVEEKIKKHVPIRPIIIGSPAEGFFIKGVEVTPKMVEIEGPKSVIVKIYSIKTEPIDITGNTSSLEYIARLNLNKKNVIADISEAKVNITVQKNKK